jgi:hypothetical protein
MIFGEEYRVQGLSRMWDERKKSKTHENKNKKNITNSEQGLITDGQVFEGVQRFTYLGALINFKKYIYIISEKNKIKNCCTK